jgi:hypothetical protein
MFSLVAGLMARASIDVGGLSQVIYECISLAHVAGACDLALMDLYTISDGGMLGMSS